MAQRTKDILKTWFETGDKPTEAQFWDLIESLQQTIRDNEIASLEMNTDGSMYFDRIGFVINIGAGSYDPYNASANYEYTTSVEGIYEKLSANIQAPIILNYDSDNGQRRFQVQAFMEADKIILQGIAKAQFGSQCCIITATVNSDSSINVAFTVGQFGTSFDEDDVRATKMSGVSFGTNSSVAASDSLIVAIGKLQAQINALKEQPDPEPEKYISVEPRSVTIPSAGTAQSVTIAANDAWTAMEI